MSSPRRRRRAIRECNHEQTHRLFNCGRCRQQVRICSRCDHGNVYCRECARICRKESQRAANERCQGKPQGRWNHAERQRKYRERRREKVTYQGSLEEPDLPKENVEQQTPAATAVTTAEVAVAPQEPAAPGPADGAEGSGNDEPWEEHIPSVDRGIPWAPALSEVYEEPRCDFCGRRCGVYSRLGFLHRR